MSSSTPPSLLVVDDEPELRGLLEEYFGRQGFAVRCAENAAAARLLIAERRSEVIVLDVNMPGENGLSLARWLREAYPSTGIVMLTTAGAAVDRIVGLELGADDYVSKPFDLRELLARVRAVQRRVASLRALEQAVAAAVAPTEAKAAGTASSAVLASTAATESAAASASPASTAASAAATRRVAFGHCQLDLDQRKLFGEQGQEIDITAAEFDLLDLFARHPNRPLNRDQIMEQAHNRGWDVFDRSIDLRVMRLRRKIERNPDKPELIKTVRSVGYVFVPRP